MVAGTVVTCSQKKPNKDRTPETQTSLNNTREFSGQADVAANIETCLSNTLCLFMMVIAAILRGIHYMLKTF